MEDLRRYFLKKEKVQFKGHKGPRTNKTKTVKDVKELLTDEEWNIVPNKDDSNKPLFEKNTEITVDVSYNCFSEFFLVGYQ